MNNEELFNDVMLKARGLTEAQQQKFFMDIVTTGIGVIRAVQGDEFVTGFLTGAIHDKSLRIVPTKEH